MNFSFKQFLKSKTVIFGLISIAIGVLTYIQGSLTTGSAITIQGILTIIFRAITKESLGGKK